MVVEGVRNYYYWKLQSLAASLKSAWGVGSLAAAMVVEEEDHKLAVLVAAAAIVVSVAGKQEHTFAT